VTLQTTSPEVSTVLERRAILDLPIQVGGSEQPPPPAAAASRRTSFSSLPVSAESLVEEYQRQSRLQPGSALRRNLGPTRRDTRFLAQTSPPYEAVEEFKVQNSLFPAEYGRGFGVINFTLRSGSNQVHGGLFEFFRNDKLDSRPFFAAARPRVRYNEYGGSLAALCGFRNFTTEKTRPFSTSTIPACAISRQQMEPS